MKNSKVSSIIAKLTDDINKGIYPAGSMIPSERDLCSMNNVSRATVRLALEKLESMKLIERRGTRGTFVKKEKSPSPRGISSRIIHFVHALVHLEEKEDLFFSFLLKEITPLIARKNQSIVLTPLPMDKSLDELIDENNIPDFAGGLILSQPLTLGNSLRLILEFGIPCVSLGRLENAPQIPFVESDHRIGVYEAVKHLVQHGRKKIAIFTGPMKNFSMSLMQIEGYRRAIADFGLEYNPLLEREIVYRDIERGFQTCMNALSEKINFDGLIVGSAESTIGVIRALTKTGLRVPDDVSVISYSDFPWLRPHMPLPMTSVKESLKALAWNLMELLEYQRDKKYNAVSNRIIIPELVKRRSCGCDYVESEINSGGMYE
ncbi:MAG TPA: GntR family transcriptional regulator [Victivallales bacterium]|nr:GntR family transcriptional regulator [Victivallales bacterium]HRU00090.1 GntR family transcriptional regulator [Victivallales bacterium]